MSKKEKYDPLGVGSDPFGLYSKEEKEDMEDEEEDEEEVEDKWCDCGNHCENCGKKMKNPKPCKCEKEDDEETVEERVERNRRRLMGM